MSNIESLTALNDDYIICDPTGSDVFIYYGYEHSDEEGNWRLYFCNGDVDFCVSHETLKKYGAQDMYMVTDNFLAGIGYLIDNGYLESNKTQISL